MIITFLSLLLLLLLLKWLFESHSDRVKNEKQGKKGDMMTDTTA